MIYTVENTLEQGITAKAYVNDNLIDGAYYADTEKGIVKFYPMPPRVKKNTDEVYSRTLRGNVTVELSDSKQVMGESE